MAVWSYNPQQAFTETITVPGVFTDVSPATRITGKMSDRILREYRLHYSVLDTPTCNSMAAFYQQQQGPLLAFDFWNVNENALRRVRFGSEMRLELFAPVYLRTGEIILTEVAS